MNPAARHELQTLRDLIRYGVSRLNAAQVALGHGSDNAWDEAVYLTLHARCTCRWTRWIPSWTPACWPRNASACGPDRPPRHRTRAGRLPDQRGPAARPPLLCGRARHRAALAHRRTADQGLTPCAGSLRRRARAGHVHRLGLPGHPGRAGLPHAQVDAVDVSPDALDVARRNVDDYGWPSGWNCTRNLFDALPARRYDVILCNPPYVNSGSMDALPQEYLHEPQLPLAGGADGMDPVPHPGAAAPSRATRACWCWKSPRARLLRSRLPRAVARGWTPRKPATSFAIDPRTTKSDTRPSD